MPDFKLQYKKRGNIKHIPKVKRCVICGSTIPVFRVSKYPAKICLKGSCLEKYEAKRKRYLTT